jgi:hypothetical protein
VTIAIGYALVATVGMVAASLPALIAAFRPSFVKV